MTESGIPARIQTIEGALNARLGDYRDLTLSRLPRNGEFLDVDLGQKEGEALVVVMVEHHLRPGASPAVTIYARAGHHPFR